MRVAFAGLAALAWGIPFVGTALFALAWPAWLPVPARLLPFGAASALAWWWALAGMRDPRVRGVAALACSALTFLAWVALLDVALAARG